VSEQLGAVDREGLVEGVEDARGQCSHGQRVLAVQLCADGELVTSQARVRVATPLSSAASPRLGADLERIGGSYSWYGLTLAWRVHALVGRAVGEYWKLSSPQEIIQGAAVD